MPPVVTTAAFLDRYTAILGFPFRHPELVPSLLPLFVGLLVIETYFGKYRFEKLGWNSAVSNSTLLITTGLSLTYQLSLQPAPAGSRSTVAWGIVAVGGLILVMNFYHVWPEHIAYHLSSGFMMQTSAYIAIATVYEQLPLDAATGFGIAGVYLSFYLFFRFLKQFVHPIKRPS